MWERSRASGVTVYLYAKNIYIYIYIYVYVYVNIHTYICIYIYVTTPWYSIGSTRFFSHRLLIHASVSARADTQRAQHPILYGSSFLEHWLPRRAQQHLLCLGFIGIGRHPQCRRGRRIGANPGENLWLFRRAQQPPPLVRLSTRSPQIASPPSTRQG